MSFFYNIVGDAMKIYVDFVLFLNFAFDLLLLLGVSIILKRKANINRIILGAFIGSLTTLFLFFNISQFFLFLFKILVSILMVIVTFGIRNIKYIMKNSLFLYLLGVVLGGVLYCLNIHFSYKQNELVFFHNGASINIIFLLIVSPIIIYFYIKQMNSLKNNYSNYYKIRINLNNKEYKFIGFLDTGNKLKDPYFNRPIILINKEKLEITDLKKVLIPYSTISENGLLECINISKVYIDKIGIRKNVLLGFMKEKITIDGVDCILQTKLLEGIKC